MHTPHQALVQIGLVHFMAFPETQQGGGDILGSLGMVAENPFFTAVELTTIKDRSVRASVRSLAQDAWLTLGYGAHPIILGGKLDLNSTDDSTRQAAVARLKESIDEAVELGAGTWTFLSGPAAAGVSEADQLSALVASTVELCRYAGERGITVTCEQFDREIEKKCLIGPAPITREYADRVCQEVGNFGICVDLSHLPILDEEAADTVPLVGEHLIHAHAGNAYLACPDDPCYGDQHPPFGYPGSVNGVPELSEFIDVLGRTGYFSRTVPTRLPLLSFEVKPLPDTAVPLMLANTERVFREAWASAEKLPE
jgi:sugar phosphate isomerase/epimerase